MQNEIQNNIQSIRAHIPMGVTLVCVSKFHPAEAIREAYAAGERHFGESRVQELKEKAALLPSDICWHFIGHLQTNKVRDLIKLHPYLIESVDSEKLLKAIDTEAGKQGLVQDVLLEVHVAREETKTGFSPEELNEQMVNGLMVNYPHIRVRGLMAMATNTDDEQEIQRCFHQAKYLFDQINTQSEVRRTNVRCTKEGESRKSNILSMGMSDYYQIAIASGSTSVRIGSAIFGERSYGPQQPSLKAVFFDMDGVLFDSMPYHARAWAETMLAHGLPFSEHDAYMNEGRTGRAVIIEAFEQVHAGEAFDEHYLEQLEESIYHDKTETFKRLQPHGSAPMRDVRGVLDCLERNHCQVWVVTGSGQLSLIEKLHTLSDVFSRERLITAYDVSHGKPDPEPYLKAWERSGFRKEECCVVENAPLGVRAGKAAGLFTIAVNTGPLPDELLRQEGADIVLPDMASLQAWFQTHYAFA